jgi:hypothetical protein
MRPAALVFAVASLAQWLVPLVGVWQHERIIARGVAVRFECGAPDPYDPFRGRFLAVRPAETMVLAPEGMPNRADGADRVMVPVWATLVADEHGLSHIQTLSLEPVSGPTVIRLGARLSVETDGAKMVMISWPLDRFYLNERLAPDADRLVAERLGRGKPPVAEIRLLDGQAVLTDILLYGVSIRETVKQQAK